MSYQSQNQRISASEILQAIASGEDIMLHKCTITGQLDVNRLFIKDEGFDCSSLDVVAAGDKRTLTLAQKMIFDSCRFEDDVLFAPPWDKPDELEVIFAEDAVFNSSVFCGQARFSKTTFRSLASFNGCRFERIAAFRSANFGGQVKFQTVAFNGYGLFNDAVFGSDAGFTNSCFSRGGNFTNVRFEGRTDFAGVYSESKSVPVYESVRFARRRYGDDETFWRFIKRASQEAGYYQLAGESFYNERCAHFWRKFRGPNYDKLTPRQKISRILKGIRLLPELIFGRWLFGYGERPVRVLVAGVLIIFVCGLFYCSPYAQLLYRGDLAETGRSFMDGLYFSTITFTTLGFGDMYPAYDHLLTRCIAMAEAVSGACLMALFVVSLSKRYSRG